jgi:hypothetical protein
MGFKKRLKREITMTALQRQCLIIVTLLSTLLLIKTWSRFQSDAMEFPEFGYVLLIMIFVMPLIWNKKSK